MSLHRIIDRIISREICLNMFCERKHCRVFARTVVVKLVRVFTRTLHPLSFFFVERQVCAASEMSFRKAGSFEHQSRDTNMPGLTRMRSARESDLFFRIPEFVACTAGDKWQCLKCLARRTKESNGVGSTEALYGFVLSVDDDQVSAMSRLDSFAANDVCKDR